jgi:hypothetical protein
MTSRSAGTTFFGLRAFWIRPTRNLRVDHRLEIWATWIVVISITCVAAARAAECQPDCACPIPKLLISQELPVKVDQTLLQRQFEALSRMSLENVEYSPLGPIKEVWSDNELLLPPEVLKLKEGDSGAVLLKLLGDLLLANGDEVLTLKEANLFEGPGGSIGGMTFLQSIRGIPVINGVVAFDYDGKTKRIHMLSAGFIPNRELPRTPKLSARQAERIAGGEIIEPTFLGYLLPCCGPRPPKLVWAIKIWSNDVEMVYVDAMSGVVVARMNMSSS